MLSCLSCAEISDSTRPRMPMPEHTSLESATTMLCALIGQFAHQTCLHLNIPMTFFDRGSNA